MRAERLARDESLREAAKRLGVSPARLSAFETGRAVLLELANAPEGKGE